MGDESDVTGGTRATLDTWRERRADGMDPVRFHFIEALDRRAAGHSGEARRILDNRLASLLAAYAEDLEKTAFTADDVDAAEDTAAQPGMPARGALGELLDHIAGCATTAKADGSAAGRVAPQSARWPEPEVLDYFRDSCGSRSNKCRAMPVRSTRAASCIGRFR
jgi:hypothetical protein